jgi:hypothetical protein
METRYIIEREQTVMIDGEKVLLERGDILISNPKLNESQYYYLNGNMGMTSSGSFTSDKTRWMKFGQDEKDRMEQYNTKPYGATRKGVWYKINESVNYDQVKKALELGKQASKKNFPNKPFADKELVELMKKLDAQAYGDALHLMQAWSEGWLMPEVNESKNLNEWGDYFVDEVQDSSSNNNDQHSEIEEWSGYQEATNDDNKGGENKKDYPDDPNNMFILNVKRKGSDEPFKPHGSPFNNEQKAKDKMNDLKHDLDNADKEYEVQKLRK